MRRRSAPVNAPLLVAEQLALEQGFGYGGAVERQERPLGPRAVLHDRTRDQLLARAALAGHENGDVLRGDTPDRLVDIQHRGAAPEQRARAVVRLGGRRLRDDDRRSQPRHVRRLGDDAAQALQVERLVEVVERAPLHGLDGGIRRLGRRDEDDGYSRVDRADLLEDFEPRLVGQAEVEEDDVWRIASHPVDAGSAGLSNVHLMVRRRKRQTNLFGQQG